MSNRGSRILSRGYRSGIKFFYRPSKIYDSVRNVPGLFCRRSARSVPLGTPSPPPSISGIIGLDMFCAAKSRA
jgi:hypothetical protein